MRGPQVRFCERDKVIANYYDLTLLDLALRCFVQVKVNNRSIIKPFPLLSLREFLRELHDKKKNLNRQKT